VSGRVLVVFDPTPPKLRVGVLLQDALNRINDETELPPEKTARYQDLLHLVRTSLPEDRYVRGAVFFSVLSFSIHFCEGLFVVSTIKSRSKIAGDASDGKPMPLLSVAAISVLLNALDTWARYERLRRWQRVGQATQQKLRTRLIARVVEQDLAFFDTHSTGGLMNLIAQSTARIGEFVERGCEMAVDKMLTVAVSGAILIYASPRLAALSCVPIFGLTLIPRFFGEKTATAYARRGETAGQFSEALENSLSGIVDVKSFTAEHEERRRLHGCDAELSEAALEAGGLWALQTGIGRGVYSIGMSINSAYGGDLMAKGKLTQLQYLRAVYMFPRLLDAVDGMGEVGRLYQTACDSAQRLRNVLDAKPAIRGGPVPISRREFRGEVTFDNVTFGYIPANPVLQKISFRLRPGETLGIVGRTGSGKSTLLRLLMRFYDVGDGRILVDGRDIREYHLKDLRSAIGLVSQDVYLFQGTVRDNVLYGRPRASDDEVMEALREAGGEELLDTLPGGLEAQVGERGRRLSGGERQRVAIARALLKMSPVLALDEVTSHLDYETEAAVQRSVRRVTKNRSLITVAHRLSTIRDSDQILVLDHGSIHESGRHDELVARDGIYASLWKLQTGEKQV
jgi:ATP-binding cassette subfamily B protein